jgi:predicted RNA polymerase sigma factor
VQGLLALMLLNDARREARFEQGELVLLADQDRSRWDESQIARGRELLDWALRWEGAARTSSRPRSHRCTPTSRRTGRRSRSCTRSSSG